MHSNALKEHKKNEGMIEGYGCTRRRPRSFTAKMPIVPGNTRSGHSTFSATRFGRDRRLAETKSALSASSPRSAIYGIRTFDLAWRAVAIVNPAVMVANCAHP